MEEELYSNSNQLYTNSNLNDEQKRFIELFNVKESGATYDKARGILYVDEFNIKSKDEPYTEDIDDIDELYTEYNDVLSNIVSVKLTNGATIFTDISSFFGSLPAVISDIRNANVVFNTYMEIAIEEYTDGSDWGFYHKNHITFNYEVTFSSNNTDMVGRSLTKLPDDKLIIDNSSLVFNGSIIIAALGVKNIKFNEELNLSTLEVIDSINLKKIKIKSGKINNIFFIDNSSKKDCYKSFKFDCLNGIADKIYLPKVFDIDKDIKKEYEIEYFSEFF